METQGLSREQAEAELSSERKTLLKADQDIREGAERLRRQRQLVLELRLAGSESGQAVRLEKLLDEVLTQWLTHREMIRNRIEYLERILGLPGEQPAHFTSIPASLPSRYRNQV